MKIVTNRNDASRRCQVSSAIRSLQVRFAGGPDDDRAARWAAARFVLARLQRLDGFRPDDPQEAANAVRPEPPSWESLGRALATFYHSEGAASRAVIGKKVSLPCSISAGLRLNK